MNWTDIEDIAEALQKRHPSFDILSVRFTVLKTMVMELDGFKGDPDKCNERVLEAIQGGWIELREEK
jgi:FeS assembly protein IscX